MESTTLRTAESSSQYTTEVEGESERQTVFDVLDDSDCRAILEATSDEPLSAKEVSEACDLPLSSTYRKLEMLTDAGMVEELTRVRQSGKHASEYARLVDDVTVSVTQSGEMAVHVTHCRPQKNPASQVPRLRQ